MDYLDFGSAPSDERCAQLGVDPDYADRARRECRALANQLKRLCGEPPPGARFRVKSNPHDFGTYYSVVVEFDAGDQIAADYAYRCDEESPDRWDSAALAELDTVCRRAAAHT